MIKLEIATSNSKDIKKFNEWTISEWGNKDFPTENLYDEWLPLSILAYQNNILIGGLRFDYYIKPEHTKKTLWINAVFVVPNSRKQGVASLLIKKAVDIARTTTFKELYVYTQFPSLYSNIGWESLEKNDDNYVLKKLLLEKI